VFEVSADGRPLFSKKRDGRFPAYQELPPRVREALEA